MANTGPDLITEIKNSAKLRSLGNCPGVPVELGRACYGTIQSDSGPGTPITSGPNMKRMINEAIGFIGSSSETAVWHFALKPTVHHFVVVPWYQHESPHGQAYTVFMAYENMYTLAQFIDRTGNVVPSAENRFQMGRDAIYLAKMFSELLTSGTAWEDYFGRVGQAQATEIQYWKYRTTTLQSAISKVRDY